MIEPDNNLSLREPGSNPVQLVQPQAVRAVHLRIGGALQGTTQVAVPGRAVLAFPTHSEASGWLSLAGASSALTLVLVAALLIPRSIRWLPTFHRSWPRQLSAGH